MASVRHIFRAPKKRLPMEELSEVRAVENRGLEGCAHGRAGQRQVLLVDGETLDAMSLAPGSIRENITTQGIDINGLRAGEQLQVGGARLEVSGVCTPCDQLERIRPGLRREMWRRRGMMCRVIEGGTIRRGDPILKVNPTTEC